MSNFKKEIDIKVSILGFLFPRMMGNVAAPTATFGFGMYSPCFLLKGIGTAQGKVLSHEVSYEFSSQSFNTR